MSVISLNKFQQVFTEFVEQRLIPSAPPNIKWILGGTSFLILRQADSMINEYLPMLRSFGLVNENGQLDVELARGFLNSAFSKSEKITFKGITLDAQEGEALIAIMEKYKDE